MHGLLDLSTPSTAPSAGAAATIGSSMVPRVLAVEDTDRLRAFLARILADEGYPVTAARPGEAALRLIDEAAEPFALVLTDVMMPVLLIGPAV